MTDVILFVFLFFLGAIVGSFLNVVALRLNTGFTMGGRSMCFNCRSTLRGLDLVPIASFIGLRGRCRYCKSKISWQYPLVEIATGILFLSIYNLQFTIYKEFSLLFIVSCLLMLAIFSIYTVIAVYDFRHGIIPDKLVYPAIILSILYYLFFIPHSVWNILAGPLIFTFFGGIWLLSRGRAMGFGDAKLGLSIGLLLGLSEGLSAVALSFWVGTAVTLLYMLIRMFFVRVYPLSGGGKRLTMKSEIPFAPFLVLGAWLAAVSHAQIFSI